MGNFLYSKILLDIYLIVFLNINLMKIQIKIIFGCNNHMIFVYKKWTKRWRKNLVKCINIYICVCIYFMVN